MEIISKFVYVKSRDTFESLLPSIPIGLDPIVFIEDSREIWTCGTYFSMNDPDIFVTEQSGSVDLNIGKSTVNIATSGDGLSIRKGVGDKIIINSTALTKIDTSYPLEWNNLTKNLKHSLSGATEGTYGPSSGVSNASIIPVPFYTLNSTGHIINAGVKNVEIRDYVEQLRPSDSAVDRDILLSYNESNDQSDRAQVRKANGLKYNDNTKKLTVEGGIISNGGIDVITGDLVVSGGKIIGNLQGDITGSAIPKIHLSDKPEYGGASKTMYGHVVLQDEFSGTPAPSSENTSNSNAEVIAKAASPYLVWNTAEEVKAHAESLPNIGTIVGQNGGINITQSNQQINITGSNGVVVTASENTINIKGIQITGLQQDGSISTVLNNIHFDKDFQLDSSNNLSLRWDEIQ